MTITILNRAADLFGIIAAANRAANATEAGRVPTRKTLRALAIDPDQFARIGR